MTARLPRIPVDSSEAAELREALEDLDRLEARHGARCKGGWLGEDLDGRPIPCPRCKPHVNVQACRCCATPRRMCDQLRRRCCEDCEHPDPPDLDTLLDVLDATAGSTR